MGNTAKKDAIKAKALSRDEQALALRLQGKDFETIGRTLGYGSRQAAHRAVKRRLEELNRQCFERAEEVKAMELARLDAMLDGLWKKAQSGDVHAVDRVLRIQERRSAYEGLDQPRALKVEVQRELETNLAKLQAGLPPDVFERVLGVLAAEHGSPEAGGDPHAAAPEDDGGDAEPG